MHMWGIAQSRLCAPRAARPVATCRVVLPRAAQARPCRPPSRASLRHPFQRRRPQRFTAECAKLWRGRDATRATGAAENGESSGARTLIVSGRPDPPERVVAPPVLIVGPFWNAQAGIRGRLQHKVQPGSNKTLAIGRGWVAVCASRTCSPTRKLRLSGMGSGCSPTSCVKETCCLND